MVSKVKSKNIKNLRKKDKRSFEVSAVPDIIFARARSLALLSCDESAPYPVPYDEPGALIVGYHQVDGFWRHYLVYRDEINGWVPVSPAVETPKGYTRGYVWRGEIIAAYDIGDVIDAVGIVKDYDGNIRWLGWSLNVDGFLAIRLPDRKDPLRLPYPDRFAQQPYFVCAASPKKS